MSAAGPGNSTKVVQKYLAKAKAIEKLDGVVAYYTRLFAVQTLMKLPSKSKDDLKLITTIMDTALEPNKQLITNLSREEAHARCEQFALQLFDHADSEDRAGNATKDTALAFHSALTFFEILQQFGEPTEDVVDKMKYAAWKATDIVKAIKEGRKPVAGPAGGDAALSNKFDDGSAASSSASSSSSSSSSSSASSFPSFTPSPAAPSSSSSFTPAPSRPPFDPFASPSSSSSTTTSTTSSSSSFSSSTPQHPFSSPSPPSSSSSSSSSSFASASAASYSTPTPYTTPAPYTQPSPSPQPGYTPAPASFSHKASAPLSCPFPVSVSAAPLIVQPADLSQVRWSKLDGVREGERFVKHALTALSFDDVDTAVNRLHIALAALLPFKKQ